MQQKRLPTEELRDVIDLCLWAGQLLMQHGADVNRVETTIHKIGTGLGCNWLDVFISASGIIVTTSSGEEFRTKLRRIVRFGGVNMGVVAAVNQMGYAVVEDGWNRHQVRAHLNQIDVMKRYYGDWLTAVFVAFSCSAFSKLFGGDWWAFGFTFVAAFFAMRVRQYLHRNNFNLLMIVMGSAFVGSGLGALSLVFNVGQTPHIPLFASVLLLVPGVPLVNSLEDLIAGHTVVGLVRGVTGALISLGIALGIALTLTIIGVADVWRGFSPPATVWEDAIWAGVAALGFAMLFNVPPRGLWGAVLCGAMGHAVRYLLVVYGSLQLSSIEVATLWGATAVGFLGYLLARWLKMPSSIFSVSGVIPMIPGTFAFGTMIAILRLAVGDGEASLLLVEASVNAIKTGLLVSALAVGIALPSLLFQRRRPIV